MDTFTENPKYAENGERWKLLNMVLELRTERRCLRGAVSLSKCVKCIGKAWKSVSMIGRALGCDGCTRYRTGLFLQLLRQMS